MVKIEKVTVQLGDKEFEIAQASFIRSKPWKKRLLGEIKPLFERINGVGDIKFDSPSDLLQLLPVAESLFLDGIETIFELLIAYSAELEAERGYIEAHATDKQIFSAFQEVVKLADFFGIVQQMNQRLGRAQTGILSNSPVANGG